MDMLEKLGLSKVEEAVAPFRMGAIQDYLTIYRHLEKREITPEQIERYLTQKINRVKLAFSKHKAANEAWLKKAPRCPDCGGLTKLSQGDDQDSQLWCPKCRWGKYIPEPVTKDLIEKLTNGQWPKAAGR